MENNQLTPGKKFASICLLSYKREEQLVECIDSIIKTADYPFELIVNSDGSDLENASYLHGVYVAGRVSKVVLNGGRNRGVGTSFANCAALAEGDYIFKTDTDLIFKHGWLTKAVRILERYEDVGAVSLFNYRHYDPQDTRFNIIDERTYGYIVDDFVSSVYGFRKKDLALNGWREDDGFHQTLKGKYGNLAITKDDMCVNNGFGIGKSVYVTGTMEAPRKTETYKYPLIFKANL